MELDSWANSTDYSEIGKSACALDRRLCGIQDVNSAGTDGMIFDLIDEIFVSSNRNLKINRGIKKNDIYYKKQDGYRQISLCICNGVSQNGRARSINRSQTWWNKLAVRSR